MTKKKQRRSRRNYIRRSVSLPADVWEKLDELPIALNALARSGPNYGKPSLRSWLHRFGQEDAPAITEHIRRQGVQAERWEMIHLVPDLTSTEEDKNGTDEGQDH